MPPIRLQKFLSAAGIASRRQAEILISEGKVRVNGQIASIGSNIDPEEDKIEVGGKIIKPREKFIYLVVNKPASYTTTRADAHAEKTVYDLLPRELKNTVWPVGRLDKNSEGLLIFTNDGELTQKLTHPRFQHEKEYLVKTENNLTPESIAKIKKGVTIDGQLLTAKIEGNGREFYATLREGKKRQIREMFRAVDSKVIFLQRIRENKLRLDNLKSGEWRYINKKNII